MMEKCGRCDRKSRGVNYNCSATLQNGPQSTAGGYVGAGQMEAASNQAHMTEGGIPRKK